MCDAIEKMYQLELSMKNSLIAGNQDIDAFNESYNAAYSNLLAANKNLNLKYDYGFALFSTVKIPLNILRNSSANATNGQIQSFDRNKVNSFFLNEFDIDISAVDVIEVPNMPDHAEAFAMECGVNDHYIAIATTKFLSYDLLIHEFAHTVEFTERRKNNTPAQILNFPTLSETIAHYYQMVYMLKYSTENERLGMLATITEAYLFYHCIQIMMKVAPNERTFNREKIYKAEEFKQFLIAYDGTYVISNFFDRYDNQNYFSIYNSVHARRLGAFLALNFIKYKLDITELFHTRYPTGNTISLKGLIEQTKLKPKVLFNFNKMEETITKFISGAL